MYIYICIHLHVCLFGYADIHTRIYIYIHTHIYIYTYIYIHTYIYTHIYINTYIYIYIYIIRIIYVYVSDFLGQQTRRMVPLALLAALAAMTSTSALEPKEGQDRVLFIGNSYTFFWNLPQNLASMALSQNISMEVRQSTASGASFAQHWTRARNLRCFQC